MLLLARTSWVAGLLRQQTWLGRVRCLGVQQQLSAVGRPGMVRVLNLLAEGLVGSSTCSAEYAAMLLPFGTITS